MIRLLAHLSTRTVYGPVQIEPPMGKATATTVLVGFFHRSNNRFIVNSASLSIWSLANGQCDAPLGREAWHSHVRLRKQQRLVDSGFS